MKGRPPRLRERPIRQLAGMRRAFPQFVPTITRSGGVVWLGTLQPSVESPVYRVRVVHEPGRSPLVFVDSPRPCRDAPHRYGDGSLCLYWPVEWRWRPAESLAETIVPWTALWLYYYESWQVTGEWSGPSSPHGSVNPEADE
jgi:hypothetical protein